MTELLLAAGRDDKAWRAVLTGFERADVYDDPAYARVTAQQIEGGTAHLVSYEGSEGRALSVLCLRPVESLPCAAALDQDVRSRLHDAVTPYGYGGPRLQPVKGQGDALREHFAALLARFCQEHGVVSEFVRFNPLYEPDDCGLYRVQPRGRVWLVDLQRSPDELLARCSAACRRAIRRAESAGLWARSIDPRENVERFGALYRQTMERLGAAQSYLFPDEYFRGLLDLDQRLLLLEVGQRDQCAALALFLVGPRAVHYHLGASHAELLGLRPNNLLFFHAMLHARRAGLCWLHLGGGMGGRKLSDPVDEGDGLDRFKAGFGGATLGFYGGERVWDERSFDLLCGSGGADTGYFPPYRGR
ncbi:MAG: peptidoglycan bridge formation glycyltransferase FemA/FemB family protein [Candidatus Alcyoniella australis]|nr:peptidoglycan bridge formation glycyltransferase FemA/FemB family protein [Candidatus Alcyoniella australis]